MVVVHARGRARRGFNGTTQFFPKLTGSLCICDELEQQLKKGSPLAELFFHTKKTNFLSSVYTVIWSNEKSSEKLVTLPKRFAAH